MAKRNPLHLALFAPSLEGGGAQRMIVNLARALVRRGETVDVVLGQAEGPYMKDIPRGAKLVDLQCRRMLHTILPLGRYLRRAKPEGIISVLDYANPCVLISDFISCTNTKVVVVNQNQMSAQLEPLSWFRANKVRLSCRLLYPLSHAVVSVSQGAAEDLAKVTHLPISRVKVIFNPAVDDVLFEEAKQPTRHPWLVQPDEPVILAVGRLTRQKNFNLLIHAFASVRKRCNAKLIILGEGELRPQLQQTIDNLGLKGVVDMPGFVSNPRSFMSQAAVVAMSSDWEAMPLALIEAASLGKSVVSTDCPSGPSEILQRGKYGRLVPVGDVEALSEALLDGVRGKLLPAPCECWQPYLVENIADQYLALFK